jgi:hypothetical protein
VPDKKYRVIQWMTGDVGAMGAINAIPGVWEASPGWVNHLDLGLIRPRGLVRT